MKKFVQPTDYTGQYPGGWAGYTFLDYDKSSNTFHPGDDYNWGPGGDSDLGKSVLAIMDGICVHSSSNQFGYGNLIVLRHDLDSVTKDYVENRYKIKTDVLFSLYAHLDERMISEKNTVHAGSLIGKVGKTGTSFAHLHAEVYAPIGELAGKPWRFYPSGWSKEKIQQYWLPFYLFIEDYNQFLTSVTNPSDKDKKIKELEDRVRSLQDELIRKLAEKEKECQQKHQTLKDTILNFIRNL